LHDEDAAALVRRFDAGDRPWATVLTPLAADDPQTSEFERSLRGLVKAALPRRLTLSRMLHRRAASGIPTSEAFGRLFTELAESAELQFLRGTQVAVASGEATTPMRRRSRSP
jgi:FxsC-like protein